MADFSSRSHPAHTSGGQDRSVLQRFGAVFVFIAFAFGGLAVAGALREMRSDPVPRLGPVVVGETDPDGGPGAPDPASNGVVDTSAGGTVGDDDPLTAVPGTESTNPAGSSANVGASSTPASPTSSAVVAPNTGASNTPTAGSVSSTSAVTTTVPRVSSVPVPTATARPSTSTPRTTVDDEEDEDDDDDDDVDEEDDD
jgi:hypothetical protein